MIRMNKKYYSILGIAAALFALCLPILSRAADEAERKVWDFSAQNFAWSGNGPLKNGVWPVRDNALRLQVSSNMLYVRQNELILPAEKANVVQIRMDAGSATKCQLWFTTGVSPQMDLQKRVDFELKPGAGMQEYTLDLKDLATWKDQISSLRFMFFGAKPGEELSIERIKIFDGEKISKPMIYTNYQPAQKPVLREFRLGSLFNDRMVLQRDKLVPVWGRARPGEVVTVVFSGQQKTATTNASGKWEVVLDPMPASDQPRTLTASSNVPEHRVELKEVLVGDVWLCGGQSNMGGSPIDNSPPEERRKELLETDYPNLRYVGMPALHRETPLPNDAADISLQWTLAEAKNVRGIPAASYYFGQALHASQKIPIGLVFLIKAGSQVEQWMSREALQAIFTQDELAKSCGMNHLAGGLFNGMVAPVHPFPIRGGFWYQGESNADNEFKYMGYYKSLPAMVRMWRTMWGRDLPVFLVQLPAFDGYPKESWAHIREVQMLTSTLLPNTGMTVTFDEGDPKNLHPANKYFVGTRLGLQARAKVYGEKIECSGPMFKAAVRQGNSMAVTFEHAGSGLKARGELTGFEIRGADGQWSPAKAEIAGPDRLVASSPTVPEPVAVRYAWANAPTSVLFNSLDLPASPFRSDVPVALIEAVKASGLLPAAK